MMLFKFYVLRQLLPVVELQSSINREGEEGDVTICHAVSLLPTQAAGKEILVRSHSSFSRKAF